MHLQSRNIAQTSFRGARSSVTTYSTVAEIDLRLWIVKSESAVPTCTFVARVRRGHAVIVTIQRYLHLLKVEIACVASVACVTIADEPLFPHGHSSPTDMHKVTTMFMC